MREALRGVSQDLRHVKPHYDGRSDCIAFNKYEHWLTEKNKNVDGVWSTFIKGGLQLNTENLFAQAAPVS